MGSPRYGIKCTWPEKNGNIRPTRAIGFGKNYAKDAQALKAGDKMLVYAVRTQKVLGIAEVVGKHPYQLLPGDKFPHRVRLEWLACVPKGKGIRASALGIRLNPQIRAYQSITPKQFAEGLAALMKRSGHLPRMAA